MFTYNCLDCKELFEIKNKPRKNRFSGLCVNCAAKKAAIDRVKITDDGLKLCKKCNENKPANTDYFLKDKKGYLYPYCRECKRKYLSEKRKNLTSIIHSDINIHENKTLKEKANRANKWAQYLVHSSRSSAKKYGKDFDIDENYILELYEKQNQKCYWFGIKLEPSILTKYPAKPSLDRIDCDKGYVKGNVVISCMAANLGRNSCDPEIFGNFCSLFRK